MLFSGRRAILTMARLTMATTLTVSCFFCRQEGFCIVRRIVAISIVATFTMALLLAAILTMAVLTYYGRAYLLWPCLLRHARTSPAQFHRCDVGGGREARVPLRLHREGPG